VDTVKVYTIILALRMLLTVMLAAATGILAISGYYWFGIIPEVFDKIFVPFFTTKQGGSGIGLSICRQIMNLHHGSISIESKVDKGTKVTLRF